ncbi:phage major capsid protein [Salinicoccus sp. HZC-1]|uniref:phage major capsid protein n=1 Tax=Salinicoccus sp. HZC-1 TaxID=3385497 RepID=UPI00398B075E
MSIDKKETKNYLKLNLQHFADTARQTFNPDNVMMHETPEGDLLNEFNEPILTDVLENSKVFQLGVVQEMEGQSEKNFTFWADKPGAYWVGEGKKIQTTKPTTIKANMRTKKVATIVLASREYLNYTYRQFFEAMKPQISEAIYKKVDEATILGVDNPFPKSIDSAVTATGQVVEGPINGDNLLALEDVLLDQDFEANAFISKRQNKSALRNSVDAQGNTLYDRTSNTIDGIQAVDLKSSSMEKGTLYAGDFDKLFYGIPYNIHYKISEEAQLSTIQNADGTPVNLYEQELIALRVTMDVATLIAKDEAFAKLMPLADTGV